MCQNPTGCGYHWSVQPKGRLICRNSNCNELKGGKYSGYCGAPLALGTITEHKTQNDAHCWTRDTNEQYSRHAQSTAWSQLLWPSFSCLIFHRMYKQQEITDNVSTWVKMVQAHSNYIEILYMMSKYIPSSSRGQFTDKHTQLPPHRNKQKTIQ